MLKRTETHHAPPEGSGLGAPTAPWDPEPSGLMAVGSLQLDGVASPV